MKCPILHSKTFGSAVTKRCEQNKPLRFHAIARRAPDQSRAPALRPSLHWHRPSLPPLLLLILMRSACTAAVHALVLTCHELHNRACGRRTKVLAAGLLTAFNELHLRSAAFFRHSFNLNAEGSSGRPLEAGHFNVPTWHPVSRGVWLRGLWSWREAKVKRLLQLWDEGVVILIAICPRPYLRTSKILTATLPPLTLKS